jgi:hypothetical protein
MVAFTLGELGALVVNLALKQQPLYLKVVKPDQ